MNNDELVELLRQHLGHKVQVDSSVCHQPWVVLEDVQVRGDKVWCYGEGDVAWVVSEDELDIQVQPIEGSYDEASAVERVKMIAAFKEAYGPSHDERRRQCHCITCEAKHQEQEKERDGKVKEELERRRGEAKEQTDPKQDKPQSDSPGNPFAGL